MTTSARWNRARAQSAGSPGADHIPRGYYKDEEKTAATFVVDPDGVRWAVLGDHATVEADGMVTLLGRGSFCINSGGEKIYPEEVEIALKSHPDVFDALVVGMPDERFGEKVAAIVQPRAGPQRRHSRNWPRTAARSSPATRCPATSCSSTRSAEPPAARPTTHGRRVRSMAGWTDERRPCPTQRARLLRARRRAAVTSGTARRDSGRRSARLRQHVHLRAVQHQGGGHALGRRRRGFTNARHRHCGDEPQHPPPDRDRVVRDHDAPPHRRSLHARPGTRYRLDVRRFGIPRITTAQLEDFVGLMRRLFRGEVVMGHDGPAGTYPVLMLDSKFDEDIPIGFVAFGPNSLALAGRVMDMVVLHTFFTDETTQRCVDTVRRAAEQAGRDPAAVRIWSCYATVPDDLPTTCGSRRRSVGSLRTCRATAISSSAPTTGIRRCSNGSGPIRWCRRSVARSTTRPTPPRSSTSPHCCPTTGWSRPPPARRSGAPSASCASSTSASTA